MNHRAPFIAVGFTVLLFAAGTPADVAVVIGHNDVDSATYKFTFEKVPVPSRSDAATSAAISIVDGRLDRNGGTVERLNDGKIPTNEDEPSANSFFDAGTNGGRLLFDIGRPVRIEQVNTYSWHPNTRGPQVYTLYGASDEADGFNPRPRKDTDPKTCGWTPIAEVDTRPKKGEGGGQYGVSISVPGETIGTYRYLLFDVSRTEAADPFGNTFYSEIDVVESGAPALSAKPTRPVPGEVRRDVFETGDGDYRIIIDTTETPDLTDWTRRDLAPVLLEWYPKIVRMLPSDGYEAPKTVVIVFSTQMQGVAATGGTRVRCAANWFRRNLEGEAIGAVVHELVHVAQQYGRARRTNPHPTRAPGWVVEGIADYIRWFLYEPETRGAEVTRRNLARAQYDASYRMSGNFLNWVVETHDKDFLRKLNAGVREGRYGEDLWKEHTGYSVQELGAQWKASLEKALADDADAGNDSETERR